MQKWTNKFFFFVVVSGFLFQCASYKQNIMLKPSEDFSPASIKNTALQSERNYVIQKNDFLLLDIFTNGGEKLVDPNPELSQTQQTSASNVEPIKYLVDLNGVAKFPMIGELKAEGLTIRQAELLLQKEYEKYFKTPFVSLRFSNKRAIVLGAQGGQVIPLENENVTLAEVLALAKGINNDGKASNIRIVRGEQIFIADLSTIEGFQKANMIIEPGDIVYVEPIRRPFVEGFRDYSIIISLFVSITSLIIVITR
jgi:polysaccharide biosynthesis/export protein